MPILDAFELDAVQALFGSKHAAHIAASWTVELYDGDPSNTDTPGVALPTGDGYAPVTVANDDTHFPVVDGEVTLTVSWTATAPWAVDGQWVVFSDAGGAKVSCPLDGAATATASGDVVTVKQPLFFDQISAIPEGF